MKLIGDRIALTMQKEENKSSSGIILSLKEEKSQIGTVAIVGDGRYLQNGQKVPLRVEVGSNVIVEKFAGTMISIEGIEYTIIKEQDIIAIL